MIGKQYIITSEQAKGEIILKYHLNGYLAELNVTAEMNEDQWQRFVAKLPYNTELADALTKMKGTSKIQVLPEDLSFDRFYDTYDNKVGKKVMTEKAWSRLSHADKVAALSGLPRYNRYLAQNPGISKAYPATYINQRYWEGYK